MSEAAHKSPTAWIPLARNIHRFVCLNDAGEVLCRHTKITGMLRHRRNAKTGAILKNGEQIKVHIKQIGASNGERAMLPYPCTAEDYDAALRSDRTW